MSLQDEAWRWHNEIRNFEISIEKPRNILIIEKHMMYLEGVYEL